MGKKKPSSADDEVLEYLRRVNRPYSATDIFNNLHGKYQKTAITKALDRLIEQEDVVSKTYGKIVIYAIKQRTDDLPSTEDIQAMDTEIEKLSKELEELRNMNQQLAQSISSLNSTPSTSDARELLKKTRQENVMYKERLESLRSGVVLIPEAERKSVDAEYTKYRKEWRTRRKMFREILNAVAEHIPGKTESFMEELGIEQDPIPYEQDPLAAL